VLAEVGSSALNDFFDFPQTKVVAPGFSVLAEFEDRLVAPLFKPAPNLFILAEASSSEHVLGDDHGA